MERPVPRAGRHRRVNDLLLDLMRVERSVGQFTFFVPEEERDTWVEELEEFERQRP